MNSRALAAKIITQVISHTSRLDAALQTAKSNAKPEDHKFIQELCYGTLRWYSRLQAIANQLLHKSLSAKDQDVNNLLLVGLYQLIYLQTPAYAAISATVDGARDLKKSWATGLINKLLRLFLQKNTQILDSVDKKSEYQYAHPNWLLQKIKLAWPQHWEQILNANNTPAPMTLRVNPKKIQREEYLKLLTEKNINAKALIDLPYAIQLTDAVPVHELPGFSEGFCYVQDQSGQYASQLLNLKNGLHVLDACAAPGSKTTDILASCDLEKFVAIEKNPERLARIEENIRRLQLNEKSLQLITADSTEVKKWWDKQLFDRILIDAPCSATGVIRRHPDIKHLRQQKDIAEQAKLQRQLLETLWPTLKSGGLLLYSTCSVLPDENENVISAFLQKNLDAESVLITISDAINLKRGLQILPTIAGPDGFYYCLIRKK
jgi:16S rRNA (cytosine967-C5)-methyltransferase